MDKNTKYAIIFLVALWVLTIVIAYTTHRVCDSKKINEAASAYVVIEEELV